MNRISFTQTEVGMMNEIVDYLMAQAEYIAPGRLRRERIQRRAGGQG